MSDELKNIASQAKEQGYEGNPSAVIGGLDDKPKYAVMQETPEIISAGINLNPGAKSEVINKPTNDVELTEEDLGVSNPGTNEVELSDDDLMSFMPDVPADIASTKTAGMKEDLTAYKKSLIIDSGFTVEEANEAMMNKAKKDAGEINNEYLKENPTLGVIEVNKTDADKLEFTAEERDKLAKVKSIKLMVVEDKELKNLKVEKVEKVQLNEGKV